MKEKKRFLWIITKNPLPITDGARVASSMLLNGLKEQGIIVDIVILAEDGELIDFSLLREKLGVKNIFIIRREKNSHDLISLLKSFLRKPYLPITLSKFASKLIKKNVQKIILGTSDNEPERSCLDDFHKWQFIVYDGLHASAFLECFGKYKKCSKINAKVIYRAQNYESELWLRRSTIEKNIILKAFLFFQYYLMKHYEKSLIMGVDGVASVSSEDLTKFKQVVPLPFNQVVPIARDFKEITSHHDEVNCSKKKELLFVGRLDWLPNKDGLKWFLDEVWQEAVKKDPYLSLTIVGSGEGEWLTPYKSIKGINFLGQVDDLKPFYQKAQAVIVPVFYGSGTRVKVIEAASFGKVCLGAELGVAGGLGLTAGEHYIKLETVTEWLDFFSSYNAKDLYEKGRNAYYLLKEDYSIENATKKFLDLCDAIVHKS